MFSSTMRGRSCLRRFSSVMSTQSCKGSSSVNGNCISGSSSCSSGSVNVHSGYNHSMWCVKWNIRGNHYGNSSRTRLYSSSSVSSFMDEQIEEQEAVRKDDKFSHQKYSFSSDFYVPNAKNYESVKPGGYSDIDKEDIDKYFPEGLAEGPLKEFEHTGRSTWMIRDISKLLSGLIDSYEIKAGLPQAEKKSTGRFGKVVNIEGLTDRKERENAVMRVLLRGTELINVTPSMNPKKPAPVLIREGIDYTKVLEDCLNKIENHENFPEKILLTGERGTGKSIALSQMVYHARKKGWICFYIPNGWDQVQSGSYIEPLKMGDGQVKYNNVFMSAEVLRGFYKAHAEELKKIPLSDKGILDKYKKAMDQFEGKWQQVASLPGRENNNFLQMRAIIEDEDNFETEDAKDKPLLHDYSFNRNIENLEDLALLGIALRDLNGLVIIDLIEELKNLNLPEHPVLLAVDQVNTWHAQSAFHYNDIPVFPQDICVPYALNFMSKKKTIIDDFKIKNGLCIAAVSFKHNEGNKLNFIDAKNSIPLLIRVPTYNQIEFLSSVLYYMAHGHVHDSHTMNDLLALRTCVGSNPRLLREEALSFLLPIQEDDGFDENFINSREHEVIDLSPLEGKGFQHKFNDEDRKLFEYAAGGN